MSTIQRNILLNPGPATTTDSVKMAQIVPDMCPREHEFGDIMEYISKELTTIVANDHDYSTILFGGSGTSVMDSILSSVIPHDKTVLIVNNGAYGNRMCEIAKSYNLNYIEFIGSGIEPVNFNVLEQIMCDNDNISHLVVIHNETTTGLLNDLDKFGTLADKYNIEFIVDAMSSYAAIPINMQKQKIDYLLASSNKNIQAMAGVAFIIARKDKLQALKNIRPRSYYLSLYDQYITFINTHQMRFTPPMQTLYALKQAIIEAKAEGIENRYNRYSQSWETLTKGLKKMGQSYLVNDEHHSKIITSIHLPENINFNHLHDYFFALNIIIYPGKVDKYNTFRIANIGEIDKRDIELFLQLYKTYLVDCAD